MWTRKTAKEATPPSSPFVINSPLFAKSPLESLIMLSRLPISSTTPSPTLSHPRQSEMHSRRTTSALLSRKKAPSSRRSLISLSEVFLIPLKLEAEGGTTFRQDHTPTVKHGGGNNLMVWRCMGWNGVGKLTEVQGIMDAQQYCNILHDEVVEIFEKLEVLEEKRIFQQD